MAVTSGAIIRQGWALYAAHWRHLVAVALAVYAGLTVLFVALVFLLGYAGLLLGYLFFLVGVFWTQGALVKAVEDVRDGRPDLTVRETIRQAWRRINALSATCLLATAAIYAGLWALVVPGLLLLARWSLIVPAIVLENAGVFRSFRRSWQLVRGSTFRVLGVVLFTALVLAAAWGASFGLNVAVPDSPWVGYPLSFVVFVVPSGVAAALVGTVWTLMYYELRDRREVA